MEYSVYVIRSLKDGRLYKGMAIDPMKRLAMHNQGKNFSTKPYIPWEIVYVKTFPNTSSARIFEKYLKSGAGRKFLIEYLTK